jgi:hypothetical protein
MGSDTQAQKRCNAHRLSSFRALGGLHNRAQEGRGQYNPKRKDWDMAKKWEYCPRRVALFLDDPNEPGLDLAWMMRTAQKAGQVEIALSYGLYPPGNRQQPCRAGELRQAGVRPVDCRTATEVPGDITDATMMRDIYRTLDHRPEIDCFILCTGDGGFKNVVTSIRAEGRMVIVVGLPGSTARDLRRYAHRYIEARTKSNGDNNRHRAQQRGGPVQPASPVQPAGGFGNNGHYRLHSLANGLPPSQKPGPSSDKGKLDLAEGSPA